MEAGQDDKGKIVWSQPMSGDWDIKDVHVVKFVKPWNIKAGKRFSQEELDLALEAYDKATSGDTEALEKFLNYFMNEYGSWN